MSSVEGHFWCVCSIEFSKQLPQLITDMGVFSIQVSYESLPSNPSEKVPEVSLAGRWVTVQGRRELWLLPDYTILQNRRPHLDSLIVSPALKPRGTSPLWSAIRDPR
jgi:hypothetical protein